MEKNNMIETYIFRFSYDHFKEKDIQDLIRYIWTYSDKHGKSCYVCTSYRDWAIKALKTKWQDEYTDFQMLILKLYYRDKRWLKISKISRQDNFFIYSILNNYKINYFFCSVPIFILKNFAVSEWARIY